jgi:hypothetical protein
VLVVVDTSVIVGEGWWFDSPSFRVLMAECRKGNHSLAVPEIVVLEAVEKFRDEAYAAREALRKALRTTNTLGIYKSAPLPTDEVLAERVTHYEKHLRAVVASVGTILPIPTVLHAEVVARALARRKPFDAKGRSGYRDTLIWETILASHGHPYGSTALLSRDGDYAESDRKELARALRDDLDARDASGTVAYYDGLAPFLAAHVEPLRQAQDTLRQRVADDPTFRHALYSEVIEACIALAPWPIRLTADDIDSSLSAYETTQASVVTPIDVTYLDIENVRRINADEFAVELLVELDADVDYELERLWAPDRTTSYRRELFSDPRFDTDVAYITGTTTTTVAIECTATYHETRGTLTGFTVTVTY